jgi:dolichyl-phosphate beta-glucosyltransferase
MAKLTNNEYLTLITIIPVYNEEKRFNYNEIKNLVDFHQNINGKILFINDGSTDKTLELLQKLERNSKNIFINDLPNNLGKANALRHGLLHSIGKSEFIAYLDFDFATSSSTFKQKFNELSQIDKESNTLIFCSRSIGISLNKINRPLYRTMPSNILGAFSDWLFKIPISDTQCGCKFFYIKNLDDFNRALQPLFIGKWFFEIELMCRLKKEKIQNVKIIESPLEEWNDIPGSKVKVIDFFKSFVILVYLKIKYKS